MKYSCSTCGWVYDEASAIPNAGILPGMRWERVPAHFRCPRCRGAKAGFVQVWSIIGATPTAVQSNSYSAKTVAVADVSAGESRYVMSYGELSALCSGLSHSCQRQYLFREAEQFALLADYYELRAQAPVQASVEQLLALMEKDQTDKYIRADAAAAAADDRGAKRILKWGQGVTRASAAILRNYQARGEQLLENAGIYLCEICGHIELSGTKPGYCPVCRVSSLKIRKVE